MKMLIPMNKSFVSVIIVTYNSQNVIGKALSALESQSLKPRQVILVDTGSETTDYLTPYHTKEGYSLALAPKESGFCIGNNIGMSLVSTKADYVLLLNPDAFLFSDFIEQAVQFIQKPENQQLAALTGTTFGYDLRADKPTGLYDSTGVFQSWYGKWYDRAQGIKVDPEMFKLAEPIPAICGAVYFIRKNALDSVLICGKDIFDSTFYMYKEDIDLSLRLRRKGWSLYFHPNLKAYHCRGWVADRSKMRRRYRLASATNELKIHVRERQLIPTVYSLAKYAAVKLLDK